MYMNIAIIENVYMNNIISPHLYINSVIIQNLYKNTIIYNYSKFVQKYCYYYSKIVHGHSTVCIKNLHIIYVLKMCT